VAKSPPDQPGRRVLILSGERDFHAVAIRALVRRLGGDADILDTGRFPASLELTQHSNAATTCHLDGRRLDEYHSIWWRRPAQPAISPDVAGAEQRRFAARECGAGLWGAIHASGVRIYNDPDAERLAGYKPYQLSTAARAGLVVPDTLITTSAQEARRFVDKHDEVIYKALTATRLALIETRPLRPGDLDDLWRLAYAPVIFQEYIPRGREYRVTVVGDRVFAAEIHIVDPEARYDWRLDTGYTVSAVTLDFDLEQRLVSLLGMLGLDSGSMDLRETPEGEVYFLEVNPSGQFLFVDAFAGTAIGEAFGEMLLR
jgi:glutathione synthase/RimK-type ligase-like ATP-grasp enzyme